MQIDSFLDYLRNERQYSSYTIKSYENDLLQFAEYVKEKHEGVFNPVDVDKDIVRAWIMTLYDQKMEVASINRKLSSLKSYFKFLMKCGRVQINPARLVKGPRGKKRLPYFVKDKDMEELLDGDDFDKSFKGVRDRLILEMLYDTGLRRSELIGIYDRDIDYDSMTIRVVGKGNKQRLIPFAERLKKLMQAYVVMRNIEVVREEENFFSREDGRPLSVNILYMIVKKKLEEVPNLSKRSPHVLRHSFATSMMNSGAELEAVKELLGHSSLASTSIYTHTTFEELKKNYHAHPRAKKEGG